MRRMDALTKIALLVAILLCGLTILDYLALHDIYRDYVSKIVLSSLDVELSKELPTWTNTELEWNAVTINYFLKIVVTIVNILLVVAIRQVVRKSAGKNLGQ